MKEIKLNILIPVDLTFEQVIDSCKNGARFVVYQYLFPRPLFPPVKRLSAIYYLAPQEKGNKYAFRYNLMLRIWGWWGLPYGPSYTYRAIKNNKAGIDLTEDVLFNLSKEDFLNKNVTIKKISSIFIHPSKATLQELVRSFKSYSADNSKLESNPIVGEFIDTKDPYYVIGLSAKDFESRENIKKHINKYFYTHTRIEFVKSNEVSEFNKKLLDQGIVLKLNDY